MTQGTRIRLIGTLAGAVLSGLGAFLTADQLNPGGKTELIVFLTVAGGIIGMAFAANFDKS